MATPIIRARSTVFDSGWHDVTADLVNGWAGQLHIRRIGLEVRFRVLGLDGAEATAHNFYFPTIGFRQVQPLGTLLLQSSLIVAHPLYLVSGGQLTRWSGAPALSATQWESGSWWLDPGIAEPSAMPGLAVP